MQDSITMAEVGSIVKVSGSRIATPFGPPSPGSTPTKMPSTSPTIIRASVFQVSRTTKPCTSRPKASINSSPAIYQRPSAASSGPFGMMTSNAMSKVTNIAAVNTKAVNSDFHSAILRVLVSAGESASGAVGSSTTISISVLDMDEIDLAHYTGWHTGYSAGVAGVNVTFGGS